MTFWLTRRAIPLLLAAPEPQPFVRAVSDARLRVSRFFVRTRKLVQQDYLDERVVRTALGGRAIEDIFLTLVDRSTRRSADATTRRRTGRSTPISCASIRGSSASRPRRESWRPRRIAP